MYDCPGPWIAGDDTVGDCARLRLLASGVCIAKTSGAAAAGAVGAACGTPTGTSDIRAAAMAKRREKAVAGSKTEGR